MLVTSYTEIMTSQLLFENIFTLGGPRVAAFADIIKVVTIFIKT